MSILRNTPTSPLPEFEYAIDVAKSCRERGIKTVAVTAGYITDSARPEFFSAMDAANVDLNANFKGILGIREFKFVDVRWAVFKVDSLL